MVIGLITEYGGCTIYTSGEYSCYLLQLVWKMDGNIWFCINLRKLNVCKIKDSYSLPRTEDTLDSLNGAIWCIALDLKLGYWQLEMDKASKPPTASRVGLLGFYQSDHMAFGLVNVPATFQMLMETCLGDLQLSQHLIYLKIHHCVF